MSFRGNAARRYCASANFRLIAGRNRSLDSIEAADTAGETWPQSILRWLPICRCLRDSAPTSLVKSCAGPARRDLRRTAPYSNRVKRPIHSMYCCTAMYAPARLRRPENRSWCAMSRPAKPSVSRWRSDCSSIPPPQPRSTIASCWCGRQRHGRGWWRSSRRLPPTRCRPSAAGCRKPIPA